MPDKCKARERFIAAGNVDIPALPIAAVRGRACFRCFTPVDQILKCGACKRAGYCSRDCQKLDWAAVHKKQCKLLQRINEHDLKDYRAKRTWDEYRHNLLQYVRSLREMDPGGNSSFIVHECPDSHSEANCNAYVKQSEIEMFRIEYFEDTGRASVVECTQQPRSEYKPLSTCRGWYDYFTRISDKADIEHCILENFDDIVVPRAGMPNEQISFQQQRRKFLILGTDILTMPLTILSALEDLTLISKPSLNIHLLGATSRELMALTCFEEMLHLMPSLTTLQMTAIGPSTILFGDRSGNYAPHESMPCCPPCQSKTKSRTIASYQGLYHDFAATSWYQKPDLIVAFNSGFYDGDDADSDWKRTIQHIVEGDIPALFTTYNSREAKNEQVMLDRLGARFVVEPGLNVWQSLVPVPELLDEEYGSWHQNNSRYIIQGRR